MSRTAWVLAALLLCGIRTAARAENADSTRSGFGGVYSSDADPDGYVSIEALVTSGEFHVRAGGRFHSVGFIQDGEYAGVLKTRPGPRDSSHVGWLRFARAGDRVEARWSEDLGGPATHVERWTLINRYRRTTTADSLPNPGDYVFVESAPQMISMEPPVYPQQARRKNIQGSVVLQVLIGRDGTVKDLFVAKSVPELDDAAIAAVKLWAFRPPQAKGQPVAVWMSVPVRFTLR